MRVRFGRSSSRLIVFLWIICLVLVFLSGVSADYLTAFLGGVGFLINLKYLFCLYISNGSIINPIIRGYLWERISERIAIREIEDYQWMLFIKEVAEIFE